MGSGLLSPTHLIFILLLAVLLFGAKRLPEIGRGLGKGMREFKDSVSGLTEVTDAIHNPTAPAAPAPTPAAVEAPAPTPAPEPAVVAPVVEVEEVSAEADGSKTDA